MSKLFTDKNGRPVQVGDVMKWTAQIGEVRAPVVRYDLLANQRTDIPADEIPEDMRRVIIVQLPANEAWLFAHDVARMESEAAQ